MPARIIQTLEEEVAQNPQNVKAWINLGNAYFDKDQYQEAIHAYENSLTIEPNNANVLNDLGVMYRRSKKPLKALEVFIKWRFLISIRPGKGYSSEFNNLRDPDILKSAYEKYISKRFHRHQTESNENGFRIVAEKGR
jgi:tetratricopeptide (TPR) repeat protein